MHDDLFSTRRSGSPYRKPSCREYLMFWQPSDSGCNRICGREKIPLHDPSRAAGWTGRIVSVCRAMKLRVEPVRAPFPYVADHGIKIIAVGRECIDRACACIALSAVSCLGNSPCHMFTEEFAEIVIPKVWMREDRKIPRVATQLSMSPKKVRRILINANVIKHSR